MLIIPIATQFFTLFFKKLKKNIKKQQKPKNMFLMFLCHLQCLFSMRSVVNAFFFKKIKIQKIRKIKLYKETRCEKKEVEGPNCFWVTWSPSN